MFLNILLEKKYRASPNLVRVKIHDFGDCLKLFFYATLHRSYKQANMLSKLFITELKWVLLALVISLVLVESVNSSFLAETAGSGVPQTFFGLNLFLEILVFFVFSTFVVFGIKGFFEMYSQKFANVVIFVSGMLLAVVIFILCFQVLSLE